MNAPSHPESTALAVADRTYEVGQVVDAAALILGPSFERVQSFAKLMSTGSVSVPKHLRGNMGDCMAITIQALGWRMNPFAVAQKTHLSQSGALGYEAQLVSAILVSTGAIKEEPEYVAIGDWSKVLGKVEERQGKARPDGSEGGKWFAATYTKKDEEGLGVIVRATLASGSKRELTVMMSQAYPRFSTQWATDPFQQLCYLAVRKWARLNSPGSVLGVYTPEELDAGPLPEKFMGPAEVVGAPPAPPAPALPAYAADAFNKNLPAWTKLIQSGKKTAADVIATLETKATLSPEQRAAIEALQPVAQDATPKRTYAEVADALRKAKTQEEIDAAMTILPADPGQQAELQELAAQCADELPAF